MDHYALIVDDNGTWRDLLSRAVERVGLKQDSASAAPRAIELIGKRQYVLALLDADLGTEQGQYGCSEILAEFKARGTEVPTIIVSGVPKIEEVTSAFQRDYKVVRNFPKTGSLMELERLIRELTVSYVSKNGSPKLAARSSRPGTTKAAKNRTTRAPKGTRVFIGHGRSPLWRELKEFLQERLALEVDEFNRVSVAGISTVDRLSRMLDAAAIAFLVLTAEDAIKSEKDRARQNVVHEVGLFQGRLGFSRAIVLLEEGCEEFSNIQGLGQIRFPRGNIRAAFEEVRHVIERERIA